MEELLEVIKKQLRFQQIISALLAIIIVLMLAGGVMLAGKVSRMSAAMNDAVEKLQEIDVEGINEAIYGTQEMMESVDAFSAAVDDVTGRVKEFDAWVSGIFGE